eukprot:TRINITY_DN3338_c0_g1_i2.p1 TRINITY_DN3338_c0_g1~~TRINITY_DN3338_c0_g1_i2.p1  ORF type:complete len:511 (-),score=74.87 TRINITY_DN3338_c0_g1_i2:178-1686(-)
MLSVLRTSSIRKSLISSWAFSSFRPRTITSRPDNANSTIGVTLPSQVGDKALGIPTAPNSNRPGNATLAAVALGVAATDPSAASSLAQLWASVSTLPVSDPMVPVLVLALLQAVMGGFDNLVHHELLLRLPWTGSAEREQLLHATRQILYFAVFLALAGITPTGVYAYGLLGILGVETTLTLADFLEEDRTRLLPWTERITHTLLTINYGAILALWVPIILSWAALPTGIAIHHYGIPGWLNFFVALGVLTWGGRDYAAWRRLTRINASAKNNPLVLNLKTPSQRFLVTGGTGFIGSKLCNALLREGHDVTLLVRDRVKAAKFFSKVGGKLTLIPSFAELNPEQSEFDVVINLAGEPIGEGRWTTAKKERIFSSRVKLTEDLLEFLKKMKNPPKTLVSGSAIGYYGVNKDNKDTEFTENSEVLEEESLSHTLCQQWEQVALSAEKLGTRVVLLRTGIVLGLDGGALSQMLIPFDLGVGGIMGSGKHWMPWVHVEDTIHIIGR